MPGSTRVVITLLGLSLVGSAAHGQTAPTAPIAMSVDASQKGRRSAATSSASSPSTSDVASMKACGSAPIPRSPTPAASATTSSRRSRP